MNIQTAATKDISGLCDLLATLFSQEAEFSADAEKQSAGLSAIISDPKIGVVLVAKDDNEILGMANLLFTVSTFLGAKVALLEDLVVHPAHRGKRIGTKLLEAAIGHAKAAGCARITLLTDGSNAEAKAFYRRAGFVESSMTPMRLTLPLLGQRDRA